MKTCPVCGAKAVDIASTCFECLYSFVEQSAEDCYETKKPQLEETPPSKLLPKEVQLSPKEVNDIFVELWHRGILEKRFLSHNGSLYIGSACFNDVALESTRTPRRAVHIYRMADGIFAEVLDGSFQVFLNGKKLDGVVPLKQNDALSFEDVRLVLA